MADQRISELFEITSSGTSFNDELPIVDRSVSQTKKITVSSLAEAGFRTASDGSLLGSKISSSSITSTQLADGAVIEAKIADLGVTSGKIANSAIHSSKIASLAVGESKIQDGAVSYAKIQNVSVTNVVLGRSSAGAGSVEEISCTAAGRALLGGASAAVQRTTLGLGNIALGTGTWTNGASVSGTNTGDQNITLTGVISGTGTAGITTSFVAGSVGSTALASNSVTTVKIQDDAVTGAKLGNDSSIVVATTAPGTGEFEGQGLYNSSSSYFSVWNGSNWAQIGGVAAITFATASGAVSPLTFTPSLVGNTSTITQDLSTQGLNRFFAGPISGSDAKPTFRALDPADLPKATNSAVGAVIPGSGLTIVSNGQIAHTNNATAGSYYRVTIDGNGHVTTGSTTLSNSDIPALDASKITTGTFGSAFIADDAISSTKIADRVICQFGETRPAQGDFVGQFFYDPLNKDTYLWDSNVWQEVTVTAGAIVLAGLYSAATNTITAVTGAGATLSGVTVSGVIPAASSGNSGYYFLVAASGVGTGNAPAVSLVPPDLIVSNGSAWYEVDISTSYAAQTANNISFTASGDISATNVQAAIQEVSTECRNASNITSGTLAAARGGTSISSYAKGDLIYASNTNVLSALPVGTLGQTLTVGAGSVVQWSTATNGTVTTVSASAPLSVTNPTTTPAIAIAAASTSAAGAVQLTDSVSTTSSILAGTATAVKTAYDLANTALPRAGGTMTGAVTMASGQSIIYQGQGYTATLSAATLTANRAISVPNASGVIVTTGASSIVSSDMLAGSIALTKLAAVTAGQVVMGNASNVATATAISGDITLDSSGVVAIATGAILNADVNASAAIQFSKLQNVSATDRILGRSSAGAGAIEEITCTAAGRALLDDADAAAQRTTLGLQIGVDVQAYSPALIPDSTTVTAVSKTLINRERCLVTAGSLTITLPASPPAGSEVTIMTAGTFVNTVVDRNGTNIMGLAEDLTIDRASTSITLLYTDGTNGWRLI